MNKAALASLALVSALVALTLPGCKPKEGKACKTEGQESCVDGKTALACHSGVWERMECRGVLGCRKVGSQAECDQSVALNNDVCNLADDVVCSSDRKSMLECKKNHWTKTSNCMGQNACVLVGKTVKCDNSVANLGDSCSHDEDYACSPDKKLSLVCKGEKFKISANCRGPKGCNVIANKINCDDSQASKDDACDHEGNYSCDVNGKAILVCKGKKFTLDEPCKGKQSCRVVGDKVGCY